MFIDTHCHMNMMVKKSFDTLLTDNELHLAGRIIEQAQQHDVTQIINVGTSLIESANCIALAQKYEPIFATVGIHPNDCTNNWRHDIEEIKKWLHNKDKNKIVAIGECGIDRHYAGYNLAQQYDAFKTQIDLSLEYDVALVVHSRDAYDETLRILEEYKHDITLGIIHCFSYDQAFADIVIGWGYSIGIDGPITYPKNESLRAIAKNISLHHMVLETDAPFLPPHIIRGKENSPHYIKHIGDYIAQLREVPIEEIAYHTTKNAQRIFNLPVIGI